MVGWIKYLREKGRSTVEVQCLHGLSLLSAVLYEPAGTAPKTVERKLRRLEHMLERENVTRAILPSGFPYAGGFRTIKPVDTLGFYRGAADLLVLGLLEGRRIKPSAARVAVSGPRLCPELKETVRHLCKRVREIRIDVPGEDGAVFSQMLQRNWGVPVMPRTITVDVTVSFGPSDRPADLILWGETPDLSGQRLTVAELDLPAELEQPLLALLWERGRLKREQIKVGKAL